jgi:two-component system phosphate regulon sensor histidine kinase PhoR
MPSSKEKESHKIEELHKLNEELENYFQNTIIPQLFVDADLILRKFTPPAMKQFNFSTSHIGKPMEDLVDNIRYSTIMENIKEVIRTNEIFEKEIQTEDSKWFQMNILPYIIQKEKKTNGVIITFVDISGRMNNLRELERLNTSHETFIYSVSHDLKAPLSNIEGLIQNLLEVSEELANGKSEGKEEMKMVEGMLKNSVKTMRDIINELSEITKIEGNYREELETIQFETILKEVELTIKEKINESKSQLLLDLKEPKIEFSRKNLRSILYNLVSNAIKYRKPGRNPEVQITTTKGTVHTVITVKDNGLGIPKDKLGLIFTPFTRYEKEVEGTGIGLYLVKKIVENAGGKITVTSEAGKGSEFKVYLLN